MDHEATVRAVGVTEDRDGGVPVVVLDVRGETLPVFVSPDQAHAIAVAVREERFERPLTHDLFVEMLTEFGGAIDRVRIDRVSDGTFYGKLDVERYADDDRHELVFDVRPSDGIAIAARVDCPILVSDEVIDDAGRGATEFELRDLDR